MRHNWEYKRLGEVCDFLGGGTPSKSNASFYTGEIPWATVRDMTSFELDNTEFKITEDAVNKSATQVLPKGMIIISTHVGLGKICILKHDTAINQDLKGVKFKTPKVNKFYFSHWYRSKSVDIIDNGHGATVKGVTLDFMRNLKIPVPSLEEQEQIVAELDKLNEMIATRKEQLKELDNLAQALFYDTFGDPLTNLKKWETRTYGDMFTITSGGTPSTKEKKYWENGTISWIGSNMCNDSILYETDGKFITEEGLNSSSAKLLYPGTVLIAMVGATIGKTALLSIPLTTNQNVAAISLNEDSIFTSMFIFYHSKFLFPLFKEIGGKKFTIASLSFIKKLPIMIPPLSLQQKFAMQVEAIEKQKELVEASIGELQTLLDSRMDYWFN